MMFQKFKANFKEFSTIENPLPEIKDIPFKYKELLFDLGGKSFDCGLYSIHTFQDSLKWTEILSQYFNKDANSFLSFAHDWMGIHYCVSRNTNEFIYLFDPATFEVFYMDKNLFDFHNNILCDSKIRNLAADFFEAALNYLDFKSVDYQKCLGFETPLFLGGKEDITNYKIYDLDFYWDIEYQLHAQIKNLEDGNDIKNVYINPFNLGNDEKLKGDSAIK